MNIFRLGEDRLLKKLSFIRELDNEVSEIDVRFRQGLLPWWEDLLPYVDGLQNDFTWHVLPPLVLAAYRFAGLNRQIGLAMANVFKTFHFANHVYCSVKDEEEGQIHDQKLQFSILIADYLFGHVLKQLVTADASHLLCYFSDMMAEINEGLVWQHKIHISPQDVLMKTRVPMYMTAFLTAAELAGFDDEKKALYRKLGFNYGMAMELLQDGRYYAEAEAYYNESRQLFYRLNQNSVASSIPLEKVLTEMYLYGCDVEKAAVV